MAKDAVTVGRNVAVRVEGNEAYVIIKLDGDLGPSSSGKTRLVASIPGAVVIPGTDIKLGLNAYKPI